MSELYALEEGQVASGLERVAVARVTVAVAKISANYGLTPERFVAMQTLGGVGGIEQIGTDG